MRARKVVIRLLHGCIVRPRVIVNAAMSLDGKIALHDGRPVRLSNEADLERVHRLRASVDAILVGVGTILKDDPRLTVKSASGSTRNPLRIVLDSNGRTPAAAHVLDGQAATLIVTSDECDRTFANADVLRCGKKQVDLAALMARLSERGVKSVLVEGGSTVIWSFLRGAVVDELKIFVASVVLGGQSAPTLAGGRGVGSISDAMRLRLDRSEPLGDGLLLEYSVVR